MRLKSNNTLQYILSIASIAVLFISIHAQEQISDNLSGFVTDGPKIGFNCKKVQVPLARGARKIIFESTVIIKKRIILITGEIVYDLICTRDESSDSGDVQNLPQDVIDDIPDDDDQEQTEQSEDKTDESEDTLTESDESEVEKVVLNEVSTDRSGSTTILSTSNQNKMETTTGDYPQEEEGGSKVVCEDQGFCVNENGDVIINGINMNNEDEEEITEGKSSRFDITSPIFGARYGFSCRQVKTTIFSARRNNKNVHDESDDEEDEDSTMNFVCKRDKSTDSGDINPRKGSKII